MALKRSKITPRQRTRRERSVILIQAWWEDRVLHGVARYAAEHEWTLDCTMRWTRRLPPEEKRGGFDGIIAHIGLKSPFEDAVRFISQASVPTVDLRFIGNLGNSPKVIIPYELVGKTGALHLSSLGFTELGFVKFADNPIENLRCEGFRNAAPSHCTVHTFRIEDLCQQLAQVRLPIGLMAANDVNGLEVIRCCREGGFLVPEEVAVLGVDDTTFVCDLTPVPLSSVNCNFEEQGYQAAALLHRLMDGEPPPEAPILITPRGVATRRSTDTYAIPDLDTAKALAFLRTRYQTPIKISDVSSVTGKSLRQIQASFHRYVGCTMLEELTRLRINHAKKLLLDPLRKIDAVACDCGFRNRFQFIHTFTRVTGEPPSEWRRAMLLSGHGATTD